MRSIVDMQSKSRLSTLKSNFIIILYNQDRDNKNKKVGLFHLVNYYFLDYKSCKEIIFSFFNIDNYHIKYLPLDDVYIYVNYDLNKHLKGSLHPEKKNTLKVQGMSV